MFYAQFIQTVSCQWGQKQNWTDKGKNYLAKQAVRLYRVWPEQGQIEEETIGSWSEIGKLFFDAMHACSLFNTCVSDVIHTSRGILSQLI